MNHDIKTAFERQTKAVTLRPGVGQNTAVTKVFLKSGVMCEIEEGDWKLKADMSIKWGGKNEGPTPGTYGRAALGSCIAMSYVLWAAKLEIPIDELSVEIQADYDTRGLCGVDNVKAGYMEMRYIVNIKSSAKEEEIIKLLDIADERSPYIDVFRNPQKLIRITRINK